VVAPAEHALVGARQTWRHLHARVRGDAVARVLVAATTTTER
jgi:hypothetical protein